MVGCSESGTHLRSGAGSTPSGTYHTFCRGSQRAEPPCFVLLGKGDLQVESGHGHSSRRRTTPPPAVDYLRGREEEVAAPRAALLRPSRQRGPASRVGAWPLLASSYHSATGC